MNKGHDGFLGHSLTLAAFAAVFLGWCGFILYHAGVLPSPSKTYEVTVRVSDSSLLIAGARVTVAGAPVGKVTSVARASDVGGGTDLTLEFTDDRVTPLPRDSRLRIRTRTQVGENYVSVSIGDDKRTIADGGRLADAQADELVDVDEILSVLRGSRKADARRMLEETGVALADRGDDLNQTLAGVTPTVHYGARLVDVLHGQREQVAQLVDQLGRVTSAVGDRGTAIETIVDRGLVSLRAIGDRDDELAATLRELPATLDTVRTATQTVGDVSDQASPVVDNLALAVRDLRPAVRNLAPAADDGRALVASLSEVNPELDLFLKSVTRVSRLLPDALPGVRTTFCQLNPALRYLKPYRKDILQSAFHLGSGSNSYDATGHLVRLVPIINENSLSGAPPEVLEATRTLFQSGAFLPQKSINYNPFMEPGEIGKSASDGSFPSGPKELAESGYKYPRVKADC